MTAQTTHFDYDEDVDILYISFSPGEKPTAAVELNENIILRFNRSERRAIGLTLMDYSVLVQPSELGHRHFVLTGLKALDADWQEVVIEILTHPPVNQFLTVSSLMSTGMVSMPIISVENPLASTLV
jgi:uncharacterized protein YuzE